MDYSKTQRGSGISNAGVGVYASAFLLGVLSVQQLPVLPTDSVLAVMIVIACLCSAILVKKNARNATPFTSYLTLSLYCILLFLFGFILSSVFAEKRLSLRLDNALVGQNIIIKGYVSSIPVTINQVQRFEFNIDSHYLHTETVDASLSAVSYQKFPKKIRLSWYYGPVVKAGERWQFQVRLKPPHGFMNPGGFDYEAWLFQHGIDATGYVRKSTQNERLSPASSSILQIREQLGRVIDEAASKSHAHSASQAFALLKALAIGDKSSITSQQWRVLSHTGTSHLMAISGLHIGLASLFAYFLVRRLVPVFIIKRLPAQHLALFAGLLLAFLYALIAGFSIATQRAMIMLAVLTFMLLIRRNHRPADALGFALFLVLLIDPLAVMSAGFWFSFSAVAVIFISLMSTRSEMDATDIEGQRNNADPGITGFNITALYGHISHIGQSFLRLLKQWLSLQLMISLFLMPLSLFMFQQVSLVSPLANLLLIPYVSFLVVPVVLLAIIFSFIFSPAAEMLFTLAAALLDFIWPLLSYLSDLPYALWVRGDVDILSLLAATVIMLLLYYARDVCSYFMSKVSCLSGVSKATENRMFGCFRLLLSLLLLSLIFQPLLFGNHQGFNQAEYQLSVLDVGQGSAAVLLTKNHALVFDAGAKFSDRLNAGSGVVIPYLRTQNIRQLDHLIISHGDADHIGGAQAIIDEYPQVRVIGQDVEKLVAEHKQVCIAGMKWQWDGVDFEFLSPNPRQLTISASNARNNHSCVLKVSSIYGSILFTGDIEKKTEKQLLRNHRQQLAADVLLVPHHGSLSSSSQDFLDQVNPEISVISVGYKNRYRLPNKRVLARYEKLDRQLLQTSNSGAITITVLTETKFKIEEYRHQVGKYWHHIVR